MAAEREGLPSTATIPPTSRHPGGVGGHAKDGGWWWDFVFGCYKILFTLGFFAGVNKMENHFSVNTAACFL